MGGKAAEFRELTSEERRADFKEKNAVLARWYENIPPIPFYADYLFHDMDEDEFRPSVVTFGLSDSERHRQPVYIDDLVDFFGRDDVAINPCGYVNNFPKSQLMRRIYAFGMDIDEVRPSNLVHLIKLIEEGQFPRPTAITNSGSGIHFFFILEEALAVGTWERYLQNFKLAQQIYFLLHKKLGDLHDGVQRHHIGQDYRVVGSLTKYGDVTTAWKSGGFWSIEHLASALGLNTAEFYHPKMVASAAMQSYAKSIAKDLGIEPPDMSRSWEVYDFISANKDAAYLVRQERRQREGKKKKRLGGWYQDTWNRVYVKTKPGNRFNAMRGLAIVAYKCRIPEEQFEQDIQWLSTLWQEKIWHEGDPFNEDNVDAIMRLFRNGARYEKTSRARLEELFGWKWTGQKRRINGRSQIEHLKRARALQTVDYPNGSWRNTKGAPTAQERVRQFRAENPTAKKADCIRATGLSKPTVYKWWDS